MALIQMDLNLIKTELATSPAFIFDNDAIVNNLRELVKLKQLSGCKVLYSMKALPLEFVITETKAFLDGLSVSSLFEARLAKEILGDNGTIHITTPGIREDEFAELTQLCCTISFNSINQYQRLQCIDSSYYSSGLRINPKLSYAQDIRYDPCRPFSKLGVDIDLIDVLPQHIEGLHFHTVFSNTSYRSLEKTVAKLEQKFGSKLGQLKWLNLGGGYLYNQIENHRPFIDLINRLRSDYNLDIYIEPGKAVVENAGYLVSTVIDLFSSDGKDIAILDTSVNHNPEIFEYQTKPEILEQHDQGEYSIILAGSTCLAGDVFGEYQFKDKLQVGDRLVFLDVGAYSLIKANRFNGYNLPDVYLSESQNNMRLIKNNTYQSFREQWVTL